MWLIEAPQARAAELATTIEDRLADSGVDVVDTRARLASYHQVENTYLATFQALGALGLLLGTLGVGAVLARNVLERQREWGLLRAVGYEPGHLRRLVLSESAVLVRAAWRSEPCRPRWPWRPRWPSVPSRCRWRSWRWCCSRSLAWDCWHRLPRCGLAGMPAVSALKTD